MLSRRTEAIYEQLRAGCELRSHTLCNGKRTELPEGVFCVCLCKLQSVTESIGDQELAQDTADLRNELVERLSASR